MNRRISVVAGALIIGIFLTGSGIFSQSAASSGSSQRRVIHLPDDNLNAPFSSGILTGNTLYLAGRTGADWTTGKLPASVDDEIKVMFDHFRATLEQANMGMDDLVYVQVSCTDFSLYDPFNTIYRTYFHSKELPPREFIGVAQLHAGSHFEMQGIAVRH